MQLTAGEQFLWDCGRQWREAAAVNIPPDPDWAALLASIRHNRMQTLVASVIKTHPRAAALPDSFAVELEADSQTVSENAALLSEALATYLALAAEQDIETVVLKGLSVSINIYGDAAMRPGGDIDILVRRSQVEACLAILDGMGIGRYWPNLMDDAYYERHHLHQQRCTRDLKVWFEIHWALDHPLTLLTIDYEAVMDRALSGRLLDQPVLDLDLPDLILSLCVHLVKHAVYLPATLDRDDLPRAILADGMLMYYLDVAEAVKKYAREIDWLQLIAVAEAGGAVDIVGSVLQVCADYLDAPVPDWVLMALPVTGVGAVTGRIMDRIVEFEINTYMGQEPDRLWNLLLATNGAFILRPIRALDLASYAFPGQAYLTRAYGRAGAATAAGHAAKAAGQYARLGIDTLYFTVERYRRLKKLNQSASLFNRLEVDS